MAVGWYAISSLKSFYVDQAITYLQNQGHLLEHEIYQYLSPVDTVSIDRICKSIGDDASIRVSILLPDGTVIGDSKMQPSEIDNNADRPEIVDASNGKIGISCRTDRKNHQNMMFVAIPLNKQNQPIAIIRTSIPLTFIEKSLQALEIKIFVGGLIIALLASLLCLYISRRISRPIEEMKQGAEQFSKGNFTFKLHTPISKEFSSLADAMNHMAVHLEDRIKTVTNQQKEIEAILSSMLEGVIAVDPEERIININQSATTMLADTNNANDYIGRHIQERFRNPVVHDFVRITLTKGKIQQADIQLHGKHVINVSCSPLCDISNRTIGALLVLNDVTQLRHLENVRRDFVANVSHEIRTPLTSIKGFVETLLSGALDEPEEAKRFLNIIDKHVIRLTAVIEDLLQLAKIEQNGTQKELDRSEGNIKDLILAAIQVCQLEADNKNIKINLNCDKRLTFMINIPLIEQAVVNLLDNAIKYSGENSSVDIEAQQIRNCLNIRIRDYGPGIARVHLKRLFERFYRVDKARSRKLGGTGLGLAIVKHIVQAHGGSVNVDSWPGKGSTFIIQITKNGKPS
ncbi:MAG: two-component system, OmpR family, phosphate regulon sensor histidine kinase PhoR [Candidatus Magnetoglobus multicellularis str. Araruama]|uniref:histidine kinase n=1 Tax=Candidatus Magnetoglobus multicellularis str. Araruama TaxID=890399 RepID=A0A1V1PB60_9BACT|nr:MAG: two-component system, OmpR family, phosphate regulon sensor histidine kinase PhoR [Candidatus Magnetoglobus multicellularis str. Araruama]